MRWARAFAVTLARGPGACEGRPGVCGIAGIVRPGGPRDGDREAVARMTGSLRHRGPDGEGLLALGGAVLGHRRLAVIDLSPQAAQPMRPAPDPGEAAPAEVAITYNGEVYDHADLRAELQELGFAFRTRCDTEVVLQGYRAWGERLPERLDGMFAFAVWDARARRLLLARDRAGEKPLYWRRLEDGGLAFASEVRALRLVPGASPSLDRAALAKYLAFDAFPGEATAFEGVRKLRAGTSLVWEDGVVRLRRYEARRYGGVDLPPDEAAAHLWDLLVDAVARRSVADVPLGVFLSGGLDSGAVLAAMAARVDPATIRTFTIGFRAPDYDESAAARALAAHFRTRHRERTLGDEDVPGLAAAVLDPLDEPLADASLLPTFALARLAREDVTVALGGDGGDELFAGYDTFLADRAARAWLAVAPDVATRAVARLAALVPPSAGKHSLQFRVARFVRGLDPDPLVRNQRWFGAFLPEEAAALVRGGGPAAAVYDDVRALRAPPGEQGLLELWTAIYLADDVLTKVDRASMTVSLEVRTPLLDPALAAFARSLPFDVKLRGLTRKWILRRALRGKLPDAVIDRRKQGFGPPVAAWLRGPLRGEVEALLRPDRVARAGLLDPQAVEAVVRTHLGGGDLRKQLWSLFVLARWCERLGLWA